MLDTHLTEMRELEDHYWWFVARRRLALALLDDAGVETSRMVDLGCGAGALLRELAERGPAVGLDRSSAALALTGERAPGALLRADIQAIPLRAESVTAVTLCDVLEHVKDDQQALNEAACVLAPGGVAVVTLPALKMLWGTHDEALHHHRRYHPRRVREMVTEAGLVLEKLSFGLFFLFPVAVVLRTLQRLVHRVTKARAETGIIGVPGWANRALIRFMDLENALIRRMNLPIGVSLVAVARKPGGPEA